jgi:dimethylaniline monooxygenase (N-oxide forming)
VFFNKAWTRVSKYISKPYRPLQWPLADRIRRLFIDTPVEDANRFIDIAPTPSSIDGNGVANFKDNGREEYQRIKSTVIKPDVLIFATGYLQSFPFFESYGNSGHRPYPMASDADVREVWKQDDPTVAFIGFVRPGFGAIPPLSEMQAMLFTMNILGVIEKPLLPDDEWHYRMIRPPSARVNYGVEHDSYAYQLAKDMDIAPTFAEVVKLGYTQGKGGWWKLPFVWAASANFVTKFRMRGSWTWDGAPNIMTSELYETVSRRKGFFGKISAHGTPLEVLPARHTHILT